MTFDHKNPQPGIYGWVSNYQYHTSPGVSNSDLKVLNDETPADLKYKKDHPELYEPTDAMMIGQAFHTLVLEPAKFNSRFAVLPREINLRTKDGQQERDRLVSSGKLLIREAQLDDVKQMVLSTQNHPMAGPLLSRMGAVYESSIYWQDRQTKLLLKCKPDILIQNFGFDGNKYNIIVDLKKCGAGKANPKQFPREIYKYLYHQQAAMYLDGVSTAYGRRFEIFMFITCEDSPPYKCAVYMCDREMIDKGHELYRRNLSIYNECIKQGIWPGYEDELITVSLPPWGLGD